jgi:hypothetical protein
MPEALNWDQITKPKSKRFTLMDTHKDFQWQNTELKENLREGDDFFLVTPGMFDYAQKIYGIQGRPVERYGITQADGETCVELYLKKLEVCPVPTGIFTLDGPRSILISRNATVKSLKDKVLRILN